MPIYEYDCPVCGCIEAIQRISDKPLAKCPVCATAGRESAVKRRISLSAFHLKGSGWYKTDYNGKSASNGNGSNGNGHAKSNGDGEAKKDAKETAKPAESASTSTSAAKSGE